MLWPRNRGHILYLGSQIARTHHCSSFSLSRSSLPPCPPSRFTLRCPPSPIAPPSTKLGSPVLLRHRTVGEKEAATVAPPSSPRCGLRRATVVPPSLLRCAFLRATVMPPLLRPGYALFRAYVAPSVVPPSPHFATVPHSHHLANYVALLLRVTAPASILRLVRHFQPPLHRQFCPG
ncbi:hypothetical protein DEO72_LG5g1918 [Vigna unguiculata]|uniref:Uncharacterized protein n=1 Tax=Vigna unguiculata TaxID=3917 RepID=A0A4D6LY73_VIGUN|nr:hypothetical protein DEO72_LG5g1918 [Vigna unguiculata]